MKSDMRAAEMVEQYECFLSRSLSLPKLTIEELARIEGMQRGIGDLALRYCPGKAPRF